MEVGREDVMPGMRRYLARAGYASLVSDVSREILAVAREVYRAAMGLVSPVALVCWFRGDEIGEDLVPVVLKGASCFSMMFFSLGSAIDEETARLFAAGEPLRGALLDAWGSEAVEALAVNVDGRLRRKHGAGSIRFAPGYGGFDVRMNAKWGERMRERNGGVFPGAVDPDTGVIAPRKSILCMIGWQDGIDQECGGVVADEDR